MRSQLREMSEWWDRVLRDQEEEHEVCREQINNATKVTAFFTSFTSPVWQKSIKFQFPYV